MVPACDVSVRNISFKKISDVLPMFIFYSLFNERLSLSDGTAVNLNLAN